MKTEFHCHSCYSFDSSLDLNVILKRCIQLGINNIVICDHDIFGLSKDELRSFSDAAITVLKAIEFTSNEGIHIIGMGEEIKKIEMPAFHYSAINLIRILKQHEFFICLPHPTHSTGVIGNKSSDTHLIEFCMSAAHFVESNNLRYGKTDNLDFYLQKYPNLKTIVGSDAHRASEVGRFFTISSGINLKDSVHKTENILKVIYDMPIHKNDRSKRGKIYFFSRMLQTTKLYQFVLNLFPPKWRRNVRKFFRLI